MPDLTILPPSDDRNNSPKTYYEQVHTECGVRLVVACASDDRADWIFYCPKCENQWDVGRTLPPIIRLHLPVEFGSEPERLKAKPEKITEEGQLCRHCKTPVLKRTHGSKAPRKNKSGYYYKWWFACPNCRAIYMDHAARRPIEKVR
jgi:hypothetical protein